jgi:hypothetical protein
MPTLPTLTVTQAQADRLLAAFGTVDQYKAWLKEQLINYVVSHESQATYQQATTTVEANEATLRSDLNSVT